MKNKSIKVTVVAFLLIITLGLVSSVVLPDKTFSQNENRALATLPKVTLSNLFNGQLGKDINEYVTDQMPLRDELIALKSSLQIVCGVRDIGGAYICTDGTYVEKVSADEKVLEENLKSISEFFEGQNFKAKYFIPVPTASQMKSDKLPKFATPYNQEQFIKKAEGTKGFKTLNLINTFKKQNSDELYFESDHHWTTFAAYTAYKEFLAVSGKTDTTQYSVKTVTNDFLGTLHSKVLYPFSKKSSIQCYQTPNDENYKIIVEGESRPIYSEDALETKDKYTYFLGGNYPIATCVGGKSGGGTLLLIKDSYANCFIPFLLGVYEKIVVIDPRYYVGSLDEVVKNENITEACAIYSVDSLSTNTSVRLILQ